jgi:hypothetical protein
MLPSQRGTSIIVRHTEYIGDIVSDNASFKVTKFSINPGLATSFPWLAAVANNYESYRFKQLHYKYKPICPTSTPGKVVIAVDYDASDATPNSKLVINSYEGAVSTSPWDEVTMNSTLSNLHKFGTQRYVRPATPPTGTDIKTYDVGNLFIATSNTPAQATTLGEIYVSYEVELFTPQLQAAAGVVNQPREPTSKTFAWQASKITISPMGIARLEAEYYNLLGFFIAQQDVDDAGNTIIDIAVNPNIRGPLKYDLNVRGFTAQQEGPLLGIPQTARGNFWQLGYDRALENGSEFRIDPFSSAALNYQRTWYSPAAMSFPENTTEDASANCVPVYRLKLPFNSVTFLNMYELAGSPQMIRSVLLNIDLPGLPPLQRDISPIDWFNTQLIESDTNVLRKR